MGIACEACHGPGEEHVRLNQDPTRRYRLHVAGGDDPSSVDPSELDARRSTHVCGQCHAVTSVYMPEPGEFSNEEAQKAMRAWSEHGYRYRPGDDLNETRHITSLEADAWHSNWLDQVFWSDGQVRVSGREFNALRRAPCWPEISCGSCHEMHLPEDAARSLDEWRDDQLASGMRGDAACLQCHQALAKDGDASAHTRHAADSDGSRCMNCHMPYTTYGLLKAIRAHEIESPSVAATLATGRPNACNQCHLDRPLAWSDEWLSKWYGASRNELPAEDRRVSAAALGVLRGDAGQRALWAWSMGWEPALAVSGSDWQAPFLANLLNDRYDAVRFVAKRSLARLPGFRGLDYDFVAPAGRTRSCQRA